MYGILTSNYRFNTEIIYPFFKGNLSFGDRTSTYIVCTKCMYRCPINTGTHICYEYTTVIIEVHVQSQKKRSCHVIVCQGCLFCLFQRFYYWILEMFRQCDTLIRSSGISSHLRDVYSLCRCCYIHCINGKLTMGKLELSLLSKDFAFN